MTVKTTQSPPSSSNKHAKWRRRVSNWGLLLFSAAMVLYFFLNPESLAPLRNITLGEIALLLTFHMILLLINTVRFRMILHKCTAQTIPLREWFRLFVQGRFLNMFVPQLGNVYRSVELNQRYQISYTSYITTLLAVVWLSTSLNLFLAFSLIAVLHPDFYLGAWPAVWVVLAMFSLVVAAPFLGRFALRLVFGQSEGRLISKLDGMLQVTTTMVRDMPWLCKVMGLSVSVFVVASMNIHVCFGMINSKPLLGETALFYTILQLSNIVRLTPGNVGPQELAFGLLGSQASVGLSQGILASALFRAGAILVLTVTALAVGVLATIRRGVKS